MNEREPAAKSLTPQARRILKLAQAGMPPIDIARRRRMTPNAVRLALTRLRKAGHAVPRSRGGGEGPSTQLFVSRAILREFRIVAKRQGLPRRVLVERLLTNIARRGEILQHVGPLREAA